MALINFYKGLKENYSPDTHGNSIYSCTDTNECYILGVLYENISEEEITNKIGTNTYTDANYISKETNLTDAAMQLDEEIKATNDNLALEHTNAESTYAKKTDLNAYLSLSGGTMTGPINITWEGLRTSLGTNRLVFYNESELWLGANAFRVVLETSNNDIIHRKNDTNYVMYDESNFVAGTNYVAPNTLNDYALKEDNKTLIIAESASANSTNAQAYTRIKNGNYNVAWRASATQIYIANSINTLESSIEFNYTMFETTGYTQYQVTLLENGTCTKSIYASFTIPTVQTVSEFPTELDNYADGSIFIKE